MMALELGARASSPVYDGPVRYALASAGVLIFFTWLDNYAFLAWSAPPPLHAVYAFVACAAALVLWNPQSPIPLLRSPLALWIAGHFLATTLWGFWVTNPAVQTVLQERWRSTAFLVAFAILFGAPRTHRVAVWSVAAAVVFASIVNVAELLGIADFNEGFQGRTIGRAAGFYINPNGSGITIVAGLAATLTALPSRWRLPLLLVGIAGVAATFSRGAALLIGVLIGWVFWSRAIDRRLAALSAVIVIAIAFLAGPGVGVLESRGVLNENTAARVQLDADDSGRTAIALKAWRVFLDAPLTGNGLGTTMSWDTDLQAHNTYLNLAADQGVIGLVTFPALLLALVATSAPGAVPLALVLAAGGMFSHGLLDDRATLLVIALVTVDGRGGRAASRGTSLGAA